MLSALDALRQLPRRIALDEAVLRSMGFVEDALGEIPADFQERLRAALAAGTVPDLLAELLADSEMERDLILVHLRGAEDAAEEGATRIEVEERGGEVVVRFHASSPSGIDHLFAALREPAIAARLAEVRVTCEDEGANGTRAFDLHPLLDEEATYPELRALHLERTQPDHHNRTIVTLKDFYEEGGGLGLLLDRAPRLRSLEAGSAPSPRFVEREAHPLEELRLSVGYDHQGFVRALAASRCFAQLATLEIVDYAETYMEGWKAMRILREDWGALFASTGLPALRRVTLVGAVLDPAERDALLGTPLGRQLELLELTPLAG